MTIGAHITDADGSGNSAAVSSHHALHTSLVEPDLAPVGTANRYRLFSQLTSSAGDGTGTTNMNANGSVTSQEFTIDSVADYDIRIMAIVIFIGDTAVTHGAFGNVSALTNGWDLELLETGVKTSLISNAKTGGDVIIQSSPTIAWGNTATSWELTNYSSTQDATVVTFPAGFLVPNGLRIGRGTSDKLISTVNDDLTGLADFFVRALGYRHYP